VSKYIVNTAKVAGIDRQRFFGFTQTCLMVKILCLFDSIRGRLRHHISILGSAPLTVMNGHFSVLHVVIFSSNAAALSSPLCAAAGVRCLSGHAKRVPRSSPQESRG
jgi:hypothetical protein